MKKFCIVGYGILGEAIHNALSSTYDLEIVDPPKGYDYDGDDIDGYILCLPTPPAEDGSCDTSLVEHYVNKYNKPMLVKSTVNPDTLVDLEKHNPTMTYSPEFLKESSSFDDFKIQEFAIFAGPDGVFWHDVFADAKVVMKCVEFTDIKTASFVKYIINTFLATKVVFFNQIAELFDGDFEELTKLVKMDKRIGKSHMQVPGPDGSKGYGGMCFPKDTNAFNEFAKGKDKPLTLLEKVIEFNEEIRLKDKKR